MSTLSPFPVPSSPDRLSVSPTTSHVLNAEGRRRRSSSLISKVEPETFEDRQDQDIQDNLNANWVHFKGAWLIHILIILLLKALFDIVPYFSQEVSWTLTNISYVIGSYLMFHQVKGTPFDFNNGAFDNLNMWEQIDNGAQFTPVKKFLLAVPIGLFLISTHYSNYDLTFFVINLVACLIVVIPKLPYSHRVRINLPFVEN
ncbi:sphingolipid homeostasis protein [Martiniozyma asiatica (nom. inval.)]|nr:sphingolipid homeostasis protein [Martiniozyma asiatica]